MESDILSSCRKSRTLEIRQQLQVKRKIRKMLQIDFLEISETQYRLLIQRSELKQHESVELAAVVCSLRGDDIIIIDFQMWQLEKYLFFFFDNRVFFVSIHSMLDQA